ncbi:MAG: DNA primase small subunit domain-containing protein [Archaeoglobaceae archaeon]
MPGKFDFLEGLEPTGLKEREVFYNNEFELQLVRKWLSYRRLENEKKDTVFAMMVGRHSNVYLPELESIKNKIVVIDEYQDLEDMNEYVLSYLPEGVYYDRNFYTDLEECNKCENCYKNCWDCECYTGQELAFDIDPENVTCPVHGTLHDKLEKGIATKFCMYEFEVVRDSTVKLWESLEKDFTDMRVVYSGRGFHIHVLDDEAVKMTYEERKALANEVSNLHIDEWVTSGGSRLIRLPFSLNGIVSKIVTPLNIGEVSSFDPRYDKRVIPEYIQARE